MKRKIVELILIFCTYILQVTMSGIISIGGITPNFLIVLPIIFGFFHGKNEGMFVGFVSGLLYDLFFSGILGFAALAFLILGYISGFFFMNYNIHEILIPIALVLTGSFAFAFCSYVGNFLLQNKTNVGFYMTRIIMPEVIYTVVTLVVFYRPLTFLNSKLDIVRKRHTNEFD